MRFFLIDRITRWEVGALAEASKNVALSEDFFDDHFPRRPVMPGVLILEGIVVNSWSTRTAYHLTSRDGIHDWTNRGLAYDPREAIVRYPAGSVNH
jgi:3-hydroxymyristoyl/3-hydroxydecanoyl-(acyl carrier protein) dehydratase